MAVEYMVTCDEIGLQTAREVLLHVPMRLLEPAPKAISTSDSEASSTSHLEDLLEVCDEHGFLDTRADICRVGGLLPRRMIIRSPMHSRPPPGCSLHEKSMDGRLSIVRGLWISLP
jgi:hypothetical protein